MYLLSFEKIWRDNEFYEIELKAESEFINLKINSYTYPETIGALAERLLSFPQKKNDCFLWKNGIKGSVYSPYFSLEFKCDEYGHVEIEIYSEIDDGGPLEKHNCSFFIRSEIGLVNRFGKSLLNMNDGDIGTKAEMKMFN